MAVYSVVAASKAGLSVAPETASALRVGSGGGGGRDFSAYQVCLEGVAVAPVDVDVLQCERRLSGLRFRERLVEACGLDPESCGVDAGRERYPEPALPALVVEPACLESFASSLVGEEACASGADVAVAVVGDRHVGGPDLLARVAGGRFGRRRGVVVEDADPGFARAVCSEAPGVSALERDRHGAVVFVGVVVQGFNANLGFAVAGGEGGAGRARVGQHRARLGGRDGDGQRFGGLAGAREFEDRIRAFGRVRRCRFDGDQREVVDRIVRSGLIVQDPSQLFDRRHEFCPCHSARVAVFLSLNGLTCSLGQVP